ncbi:hypothetical protein GLOTRDRAFT_138588 [Gloeophyllum trabeum ATCC 11539]|uniref:Uncharacterized protein n=1 Tax=Gloeophyllum trabeum (strain ATCC 11539 / FP-39264 / Madison 617) TaxID=670483 RepID=S7Q707_GLOTA|nr:uncharacterized protein GLOTRDRAFT_138588 [Gloeophyllum trabeum ATCC 11539]EPQ55816.1 hypothetical protein GLOTRDRAFT_138588 [Gloeophyllum trabeum ATCC 11539]
MRPSLLLAFLVAFSGVQASWFGSDPEYSKWDEKQLRSWLHEHHIEVPKSYDKNELQDLVKANWNSASSWTQDSYYKAQQSFQGIKDSTFDAWDDSRLREFLLEQGVVNPSGPREQLVLLAKQKYKSYTDYASSLSSTASKSASTAIYGDSAHQASKSASSVIAQATQTAAKKLDDTKDYVYSTWDDNRLRSYLEQKGVIEPKQQATREQLLGYMRDAYAKTANPVWDAWSDSALHQWLVEHGVIKSDFEKNRDKLYQKMNMYYYDVTEPVWSTWDESTTRQWLIDHGIIKSDAQLKKEKMQKLVADNYLNAKDTAWGAWKDSDMRDWLIEHGYLRSDAQVRRDELIKYMNDHYNDYSARTAAYLTWPDARLRAYLREHGISEDALPTSRPGLLQEVRIRWVQTQTKTEALYIKLRSLLASGVYIAEEKLGQALDILSGHAEESKRYAGDKYEETKDWAGEKYDENKAYANEKYEQGKGYANEKAADASDYAHGKASSVSAKGQASSVKGKFYQATGKAKAEL